MFGSVSFADLSVTADHVFISRQFFQSHGTSGVQFLCGDAHLAAQAKFAPVGETGGGIDVPTFTTIFICKTPLSKVVYYCKVIARRYQLGEPTGKPVGRREDSTGMIFIVLYPTYPKSVIGMYRIVGRPSVTASSTSRLTGCTVSPAEMTKSARPRCAFEWLFS